MEQKCFHDKIISLHLQRCSGYCPNASFCYHMKKEKRDTLIENPIQFTYRCVASGATVYDSVCNLQEHHISLLNNYNNYNITISAKELSEAISIANRVQVSVYNCDELYAFNDYQKLFLIKDTKSYLQFENWLGNLEYGRLHFIFDQSRLTAEVLEHSIRVFNEKACAGQSMDSCISSFLINGECPYNSSNYIDISGDRTIRKCPYRKNGIEFEENSEIEELFNLTFKPKCKYTEFFEEN